MANPDHIKRLLEGPEDWNESRKAQPFTPDFSGAHLVKSFKDARQNIGQRLPLRGYDLHDADFSEANLKGADFSFYRRHELRYAKPSDAEGESFATEFTDSIGSTETRFDRSGTFRQQTSNPPLKSERIRSTVLRNALFQGANLENTDFSGADLTGARVDTQQKGFGPDAQFITTDLSGTNITQAQLETMRGDTRVTLPPGCHYPENWGHVDPTAAQTARAGTTRADMRPQIALLLRTAPTAAASARHVAQQIEDTVNSFHARTGENRSDEGDVFHSVAQGFMALAGAVETAQADPAHIAALEATIAAQAAEIARLNIALTASPSARRQIMIAALGGAGAVAITNMAAYALGPESAEVIAKFWSWLAPSHQPPPPPVPPIPRI